MRWPSKRTIEQFVPPVMLPTLRAIRNGWQPGETADQRAGRIEHEDLNRDASADEIRLRPGLTLKLHPGSREGFEAFCYRYPEMVEEMNSFVTQTAGRHALLDVGALHGIFSLVFSAKNPEGRAVAVDASPVAFARLLYNLHKNRAGHVTPVECALSNRLGVVRMHYEWEQAVAAGTTAGTAGLSVEARTGDDLCASLGFRPDVIKIDVEGHEVKVLDGLKATIRDSKPLLFLEIHPTRVTEEGDRLDDVERFLADLGYRAESTNGKPLPMSVISTATTDRRMVLHPS
jgi:FkbM family methyltransferase